MDKKTMNMREAAEALGVSADTIRRRIKEGKIRARKIQGAYGPEWQIDPDTIAEAQQVLEVVSVKHNLDAADLQEIIRVAAQEGTAEGIKVLIQEMNELRQQVEQLQKQLQEQQQEKKKGLFNFFRN